MKKNKSKNNEPESLKTVIWLIVSRERNNFSLFNARWKTNDSKTLCIDIFEYNNQWWTLYT